MGDKEHFYIRRSFLYFETAGIPDGAIITDVKLKMYGVDQYDTDVCVMKGSQADTLTTADFDSFTGFEYSHTSWSSGWNTITFNSTGRSDINKTGISKICMRENTHDYANSSPPSGATNDYSNHAYSANNASNKPYLDITYSLRKTKTYNFTSLLKATKLKTKLMDTILELVGTWKEEKFPVLVDQYATTSNYYPSDNLEWGNSDDKRAFMRFQPNMPKSIIIREAFIEVGATEDQSANMITEINRLSSSNISFSQNLFSANVDDNTNIWKTPKFEISETYRTATITDILNEFIEDPDYNTDDYFPIRFMNVSGGIRKVWQ